MAKTVSLYESKARRGDGNEGMRVARMRQSVASALCGVRWPVSFAVQRACSGRLVEGAVTLASLIDCYSRFSVGSARVPPTNDTLIYDARTPVTNKYLT